MSRAAKIPARQLLRPQYLKVAEQFCKAAENDALAKCNQLLADLALPALRAPLAPSGDDVPVIGDNAFKCDRLKERPAWNLGLWHTEYEGPTLLAHIEAVAKSWRHQIEARKDAWVRGLTNSQVSKFEHLSGCQVTFVA